MGREEIIALMAKNYATAAERESRRNRAEDRFLLAVAVAAIAVSILAVLLGA